MALQEAILAALLEGEASGYDLAKGFDASVANFWTATPQQLYRELERMASKGLVRARVVEQERRPNKRVFSLTDAGRSALHDFTARAPRPSAIRDELLVQVQALEAADPASVRRAVEGMLETSRAKLVRYERVRKHLLGGRTEAEHLAWAERVGPFLTLTRGIAFEHENIRWGEHVLGVLADRGEAS